MGFYLNLINIGRYTQERRERAHVDNSPANGENYRKQRKKKASATRKPHGGSRFFRSPLVVSFIGLLCISCLFQFHLYYVLLAGVGSSRDLSIQKHESIDATDVGLLNQTNITRPPNTVNVISSTTTDAVGTADHPRISSRIEETRKKVYLRHGYKPLVEVDPILRPIVESGGKFYILNRRDRSGRVVADMLYAHAFAYAHNLTYGGLCWIQGRYKDEIYSLIRDLQWDHVLPLACPEGVDIEKFVKKYSPNEQNATEVSPLILNTDVYKIHSNFKSDWVKKISKDLVDQFFMEKEEKIKSQTDVRPFEIAVHVRRGDIEPCHFPSRYLPNSYYLELIDRYTPEKDELDGRPLDITIYSESDSYESFDEFTERGYNLNLDTPKLGDVWRALSTADVAILSSSYFSVVPAIINPNIVIIPEYSQFKALSGWGVVRVSREHRRQMERMHDDCESDANKSR